MNRIFIYADTTSWHTFNISQSDILKETDKAYFINTHEHNGADFGIWIAKKLVRPRGNGYQVSVGNDFEIKPLMHEKKYRDVDDKIGGGGYLQISQNALHEIMSGKDFARLMNEKNKVEIVDYLLHMEKTLGTKIISNILKSKEKYKGIASAENQLEKMLEKAKNAYIVTQELIKDVKRGDDFNHSEYNKLVGDFHYLKTALNNFHKWNYKKLKG